MQSLGGKQFAPVYLIDGEESYYLDMITEYVEEKILQPGERDFNLTVLYGKDADWADVVNACRRFPMFAERQVVILKDAAQMKTLGELAGYVENPSPTTLFLIEHRGKKTDGRSRLLKVVKEKGVYFTSDKVKDEQIPQWIQLFGKEHDLHIGQKESEILATYLGNDLGKITNEIAKVRINVPEEKVLTAALIQKFIGISREYNIFEFPEALTSGNKDKLYRMLAYFLANPKSAPMPLIVGSFYNHLEQLYVSTYVAGKPEQEVVSLLNLKNAWMAKKYLQRTRHSLPAIEACLLLLAEYNTKSVGIRSHADASELLKELVGKLELVLDGHLAPQVKPVG
jgi:DNA polymerase-3 subunit delta